MVKQTRKGASRMADVSPEVLLELEAGRLEAATLAENLATNFQRLFTSVFPELSGIAAEIKTDDGITKRMAAVATIIFDQYGDTRLEYLASHRSDLVRGWGAYLLACLPDLSLADRIERMRRFADDDHFGVREWSWLAIRGHIADAPKEAVCLLERWTGDKSANIRRFSSEATRPRGVWSPHIGILKADPSIGLPILTPLRADPSRYVQDSVANWLNDAWKSAPNWVEQLCDSWTMENQSEHTRYIVKRALRTARA